MVVSPSAARTRSRARGNRRIDVQTSAPVPANANATSAISTGEVTRRNDSAARVRLAGESGTAIRVREARAVEVGAWLHAARTTRAARTAGSAGSARARRSARARTSARARRIGAPTGGASIRAAIRVDVACPAGHRAGGRGRHGHGAIDAGVPRVGRRALAGATKIPDRAILIHLTRLPGRLAATGEEGGQADTSDENAGEETARDREVPHLGIHPDTRPLSRRSTNPAKQTSGG